MNKIDWKKYADYIFCINYLNNNRHTSISQTLRNIGIDINDNSFFSFMYDIKHKIFNAERNTIKAKSFDFFNRNSYYSDSYLSCKEHEYIFYLGLVTYRILKIAQYFKYERIIIFEDDIVFLKDIDYIINAMDFIKNQSFDICMCQTGFLQAYSGDKSSLIKHNKIKDLNNDMFLRTSYPMGLYGGAFIILTNKGINKIIDYFEENDLIVCLDVLDTFRDIIDLDTIFALKPLCIQQNMIEWSEERINNENINMKINEYI